ncbi:putative ER lumen protein-retaining receptor C28H8.4 [Trichogramma pretiosum]|uniref:ER lumen protein-retaining receptor n=1 Tax=Trichogramma kaykai TaxID=54128 RepID=A0ABD2W4K9_9HYME|nr:putative ER lumen protein-retaining receptor C28H8.4 [Trichogramma pretiosum]
MDQFDNVGIFLQLVAMFLLLIKILTTCDCTGISGRTQALLALSFTSRFLDAPYEFEEHRPIFVVKSMFVTLSYSTLLLIYYVWRSTYQRDLDTFRWELATGACMTLALLSSTQYWDSLVTIMWYFSVYIEAVAIFPQIQLSQKTKYIGRSLFAYVGLFACYRFFYIVHWIYLYLVMGQLSDPFLMVAGTAQCIFTSAYFVWMIKAFNSQYHSEYPYVVRYDLGSQECDDFKDKDLSVIVK